MICQLTYFCIASITISGNERLKQIKPDFIKYPQFKKSEVQREDGWTTHKYCGHLTPEQLELADLMSEISETCYCAGWMLGLEYAIWGALQDGDRTYGMSEMENTVQIEMPHPEGQISGYSIVWDFDEEDPENNETDQLGAGFNAAFYTYRGKGTYQILISTWGPTPQKGGEFARCTVNI